MNIIFTINAARKDIEYRTLELAYEKDYKEGFTASYPFEEADMDKIEDLDEFQIYEMMEGVYELPDDLTIEEIKIILTNKGFIDSETIQK